MNITEQKTFFMRFSLNNDIIRARHHRVAIPQIQRQNFSKCSIHHQLHTSLLLSVLVDGKRYTPAAVFRKER